EESNDVTTMSLDALQSSLIVHEQKMKSKKVVNHDEQAALTISGAGRGRGRNSSSRWRSRGRISKETVECFKCHQLGHYKNECPTWEEAKYGEADYEEEFLLMTGKDCEEFETERWYLDWGVAEEE
ncbi:(+)-delta-cadinene synthase isozyme a, partial [Trifolium pratense]